ncbi:hypothetical protein OUZ56_002781 [Daphnia magna]|uniref:Uncharacterized protein n=1 Tax=Daphnia magna TaxID=35525 RepID=A0ABR0A6U5_9CRUS|nr:hypothetical protein OUZ56_002781 [Daphnia magna]
MRLPEGAGDGASADAQFHMFRIHHESLIYRRRITYGLHLLSDVQLVSMCHLLSSPSTTLTKPKNSKMLTMER